MSILLKQIDQGDSEKENLTSGLDRSSGTDLRNSFVFKNPKERRAKLKP